MWIVMISINFGFLQNFEYFNISLYRHRHVSLQDMEIRGQLVWRLKLFFSKSFSLFNLTDWMFGIRGSMQVSINWICYQSNKKTNTRPSPSKNCTATKSLDTMQAWIYKETDRGKRISCTILSKVSRNKVISSLQETTHAGPRVGKETRGPRRAKNYSKILGVLSE